MSACELPTPMTSSSLHRRMSALPSIPVAPKMRTRMFRLCRTYELREDIALSASTNSVSDTGPPLSPPQDLRQRRSDRDPSLCSMPLRNLSQTSPWNPSTHTLPQRHGAENV